MFREKRLTQKDLNAADSIVTALDITKPKAETYAESLHDNASSGPWNSEKIEAAKSISFPIKGVMDEVRTKAKEVFWDTPKGWTQSLASMLAKPVFMIPAWLWSKTTQLPAAITKLVTSGVLVANAELWQALDYPARLMVQTNNRIQQALGAGGGGHAAPAPAH